MATTRFPVPHCGCARSERRPRGFARRAGQVRFAAAAHVIAAATATALAGCSPEPPDPGCPSGLVRTEDHLCVPRGAGGAHDAGGFPVDAGGGWDPSQPDPSRPNPTQPPGVPSACPADAALARLDEVLPNPSGPDIEGEFIELLIERAGSLDGMQLQLHDAATGATYLTIPLHGRHAAGERVLWGTVPGAHAWPCTRSTGCIQNGPDGVLLLDCAGAVVDAWFYGAPPPGGPAWTRTLPTPREGRSLAMCRRAGVAGTGQLGAALPTPGAETVSFDDASFCAASPPPPPPCRPGPLAVINELLYDPVGPDAGWEFVELFGPPGASVDGLWLEAINGADGRPLFAPVRLEGRFSPTGFFVVGGAFVPERDQLLEVTIQNGPETVLVTTCDGVVRDALAWGNPTGAQLFGHGTPALSVPAGRSLGRLPDGFDSRDNRSDFIGFRPTPGRTNEDGWID